MLTPPHLGIYEIVHTHTYVVTMFQSSSHVLYPFAILGSSNVTDELSSSLHTKWIMKTLSKTF